jgi:hypothetical protein
VFRELIQNADDCKADWLAIGFSEGLPEADHRFLRGPGLFAVNNGPLRPSDVEAISSLSLGTKIADAGSVGKFGLGLKSVFKFAEMMFYADYRLDPDRPREYGTDISGDAAHFDVLSPWLNQKGRRSRQDWEPFTITDRERLGKRLRALGIEDGFAVWVPLRQASHGLTASILSTFDEDVNDSEKLIGSELLRVFPLLQHLKTISYKDPGQPLVTLRREGGTRRTLANDTQCFEATAQGVLHIGQTQKPYPYILQELLSDSPAFKHLKSSEAWPKFTRYDDHTGEENQVVDPAIPHAGVVWQRLPPQSAAQLEAGLAVFLPLSHRTLTTLKAGESYRLTLHGYFFPTDDRQGIVGSDQSRTATGESRIKGQWNDLLKEQLIAPRILEGLQSITAGVEQEEVDEVTQALWTAVRELRFTPGNLTSRHQWVNVWNGPVKKWQLMPSGQALLPLDGGHWEECWRAAVQAAGDRPLYDPGAPNLLSRKETWDEASTRAFLSALDWNSLLQDAEQCGWLQSMLKRMTFSGLSADLVEQLRSPVATMSPISEEAASLVRALLPLHTASLPEEVDEASPIRSMPLSILLLPQGLGGNASLNFEDGASLLRRGNSVEALATILHLVQPAEFLETRAVIPVGRRSISPLEARQLVAEKQLFQSEGRDGDLLHLLNSVLPKPLEFVESRYNTLFKLGAPPLAPRAALQTLEAAESLSGGLPERLKLFQNLLKRLTVTSDNRALLRYLLHGVRANLLNPAPLTYDAGDVWGKAGRLANKSKGLWSFVPRSFPFLTDIQKEDLGLQPVTAGNIEQLLIGSGDSFPVSELTAAEINLLLSALPWSVLEAVPLLTTVHGRQIKAGPQVFLEGSIKPEGRLAELVELVHVPKDEGLQKKFKQTLKAVTEKDVWRLLKVDQPWREWRMLLKVVNPREAGDTPWLPLRSADAGLPLSQLLFLIDDGKLVGEQLLKQLAEGSDLCTASDLNSAFSSQAFRVMPRKDQPDTCVFQPYFSLDEQIGKLTGLLSRSHKFGSGLSAPWLPDHLTKYKKAFATAPEGVSPLHDLLTLPMLSRHQETLLKAATAASHAEQLEGQLRFLSRRLRDNPRSEEVRWVYLQLLGSLRGPLKEKLLPSLFFPCADGEIKAAEDLVPFDHDLERRQVLDQTFSEALFPQGKQSLSGQEGDGDASPGGSGYAALLRHIRDRWDDAPVDRPLLGLFLLLLDGSDELRQAARPYLKLDADVVRDEAFAGSRHRPEMDLIRARIELVQEDTKTAVNLLGEEVSVRLQEKVRSLFTRPAPSVVRHYQYPVSLRVIDPRTQPGEELNQLLLQTLKDLYRYYGEVPEGLEEAFKKGRESEATALRVTQRRLIKAAPQTWKQQLSVPSGSELGALLEQMNQADRKFEEAREKSNLKAHQAAQEQFDRLIMEVQKTLLESPDTCEVLLQGVRHRIEQSQYLPESVPFELLQNADDALVEWELLGGDLTGRTACELTLQGNEFTFRHRGRPINRATLREHDMTESGYDGDLEKMLTLVASNKTGSAVTGKFGLGFKSIYLLGDRPTVLSGDTRFTVLGGVYPKQPDVEEIERLKTAHVLTNDDTLIHLRVNNVELAEEVLAHFEGLVPVLLAFTQRVDEVTVQGRAYRCHRREVAAKGIEHLEVTSPAGSRHFLCLHAGPGKLLLSVGSDGFRPLEEAIPRLWCLAPLREQSGVPVAAGAAFPVDPGRARIATDKLSVLVATWQHELFLLLQALDQSWPDLAREFNWDTDRRGFLERLWELLAAAPDSGDVIKTLLWGESGAYRRWALEGQVVPSGLTGHHAHLLNPLGVRGLPGGMSGLLTYGPFAQVFTPGKLMSATRATQVEAVLGLDIPRLSAAEVLKALIPKGQVSVERSKLLQHAELQGDEWWNSAQFKNQAGEWCLVGSLSTQTNEYHPVLPATRQLSSDYPAEIAAMIEKRWPVQLSTDDAARSLVAVPDKQKAAALTFLKRLSPDHPVSTKLRTRLERGWLSEEKLESAPTWKTLEQRQQIHIKNLLGIQVTSPEPKKVQAKPLPPGALEKISQWWEQESEKELAKYAGDLYAGRAPDLTSFTPDDPASRADWFTVLMLGSFQSMGRQKQSQHAGFLKLCRDKGWLRTFSTEESSPEDWHGVLDGFLGRNSNYLEYYYWMDGYLSYYQFGRWLGTYAELLLDLPRTELAEAQQGAARLLAINTRPSYQGSGLSAPPLMHALGQGAHLVVREVLRQHPNGRTATSVHPLAYMPSSRVKNLLSRIRKNDFQDKDGSEVIYRWLCQELDPDRATFGGAFDVPLDLLATDESICKRVLGLP